MAEAYIQQQLQPTEMHTRHSSENYGPTRTPTSTVMQYTNMRSTQTEMPGSTAENTTLVGLHHLPQLPPERPLHRPNSEDRLQLIPGPGSRHIYAIRGKRGTTTRNMFSPARPDAEEDRGLHCIEPVRPAPQGRRAQQLAQPLQDQFTTDDVGKLNEVLPQPLSTYPSRRDTETAIGNLPKQVNRTLLTRLSPQAQDMITRIRRNVLVRNRTLRVVQLQRDNDHLNAYVTRLQKRDTEQQAENARLRVMVGQLRHQKDVLLKFCNERLQQQTAALAMINTGVTTVGNSHHSDNDQRKTNHSAQ